MHFCEFATRLYAGVWVPRKIGLNWFMPALVNSSVGSSQGTTLDDGTAVWPCFWTKKSRNCWRISFALGIVKPWREPQMNTDQHRSKYKTIGNESVFICVYLWRIGRIG